MVEYMGSAHPRVDQGFLDEIRRAVAKSNQMLDALTSVSASTKRELLSGDVEVARRAASELYHAYFQSK